MSTATVTPTRIQQMSGRQRSIWLVTCCTFIGAAAQILIKTGAGSVNAHGLIPTLLAMASNLRLVFGYGLYGISAVLMTLALRDGELSILYPIIALTYVWVSILSVLIFREQMNVLRMLGIAIIVAGVAVLGRGSRS